MKIKKMVIIDGYSLINRAFYAISGRSMLTTADGMPTNAIYGFLNILFRYMDEEKPDYLCVAFDVKKPTFRHIQYGGYKATRKKMPEDLAVQIPFIKETLDALNFGTAELEGYEADDLIGTLAKKGVESNIDIVVVSGDRDLLQIIEDGITVKVPVTKGGKTETEVYDVNAVNEKYSLKPFQLIELKALMGDSSDNIPGVKGVGEKSALTLIGKYGNLENMYANIDEITGALKTKLLTYKDDAFLSRTLGTIIKNVPYEFDFSKFEILGFNNEKLFNIFSKLQFKSLIDKFSLTQESAVVNKDKLDLDFYNIDDTNTLVDIRKKILDKGFCGLDFEMSDDGLFFLGLSIGEERVYSIALNSNNLKEFSKDIIEIIKDETVKKYVPDLKKLLQILRKLEFGIGSNYFDISIAAYLLDPAKQKYNIKELATSYLNIEDEDKYDINKKVAGDAYLSLSLSKIFEPRLVEYNHEKLFYEIEMPLPEIMDEMETSGIRVDMVALKEYGDNLCVSIAEVEKEIFDLAGEVFNINSPKQLGQILFEKLALPVIKKNKTGYSTDAEVLEELRDHHLIVDKLLFYRQIVKLNTTYVESLYGLIDPKTNLVHTKFNQTGTVTGRFTSIEPNMQNIPYRQELGRKIRKVFVPRDKDYVIVGADYSQIELRILAHMTEDENLIDAYQQGKDIHSMTASKVFGVSQDDVSPLLRTRAKAINFGIIYGLGEYSLAKDIGVTRKEAKIYIEEYLGQYPKVKEYMVNIVESAKKFGYVETIFGRRRYLPDISSKNFNIRTFAQRQALNAPIQGTAADIMKLAMVKIFEALKINNLKSKMVLQVHDEVLIDTYIPEKELVKEIIKNCMENVIKLKVPLMVDVKEGNNWYETK